MYATFEHFNRTQKGEKSKHPPIAVFVVCWRPVVRRERATMALWGRNPLLVGFTLWMTFGRAAALPEQHICYVLDGILFLYGIILTALYCRIKINNAKESQGAKGKAKPGTEDGVYMGLTPHAQDTYETIGVKK